MNREWQGRDENDRQYEDTAIGEDNEGNKNSVQLRTDHRDHVLYGSTDEDKKILYGEKSWTETTETVYKNKTRSGGWLISTHKYYMAGETMKG